jgi:hypothetical protein
MRAKEELIAEARACFASDMMLYSTIIQNLTAADAGFSALDPSGMTQEDIMRRNFVHSVTACLKAGKISQKGFDFFVRDNQENPLVKSAFPFVPVFESAP